MDVPVKITPSAESSGDAAEPVKSTSVNAGASRRDSTAPGEDIALSELDDLIASNLDEALQGNFESIDAVLDGVFDERAVLVQNADGSPVVPNTQREMTSVPPPKAAEPDSVAESSSSPTPAEHAVTPVPKATETPANIAAESAAESVAESLPPVAEAKPVTTAPIANSSPPPATPPAAAPEAVAAAAVAAVAEAPAVAAIGGGTSIASADGEPRPNHSETTEVSNSKKRFAQPSGVVLDGVRRLLAIVNSPLAKLPQHMRPMVDWVALTLLAWVPIVWLMALLNGPGHAAVETTPQESATTLDSQTDQRSESSAGASADSSAAARAALHEESHLGNRH
jgi:hypothetical protein